MNTDSCFYYQDVIKRYLDALLTKNVSCSLSKVNFSLQHPPFRLKNCEHRFTKEALILIVRNIDAKSILNCPRCGIMSDFGFLDLHHLRTIHFNTEIQEMEKKINSGDFGKMTEYDKWKQSKEDEFRSFLKKNEFFVWSPELLFLMI